MMTHSPPNPSCRACTLGKGLRIQHRKGALKRHGGKPTKEGELLTMDWIILKNEVSKGEGGETVLQNLLDVGTDFLTVNPSVKRNAEAAYNGILKAYGNRCKVQYCRMDDAPELKKACKMRRISVRDICSVHTSVEWTDRELQQDRALWGKSLF